MRFFLSRHCGENDILTPIYPHVEPHIARNFKGLWNPLRSSANLLTLHAIKRTFKELCSLNKFFSHIPAVDVRARISRKIWDNYFKFCVERNPWDKTLSYYHMLNHKSGGKMTLEEYFEKGDFCVNYPKYTDKNGGLIVDRVIKYESLTAELGQIFDSLGIPFEGSLGVKAKSEYRNDRTPYREIFSNKQIKIMEKVFEKEIAMHGYRY